MKDVAKGSQRAVSETEGVIAQNDVPVAGSVAGGGPDQVAPASSSSSSAQIATAPATSSAGTRTVSPRSGSPRPNQGRARLGGAPTQQVRSSPADVSERPQRQARADVDPASSVERQKTSEAADAPPDMGLPRVAEAPRPTVPDRTFEDVVIPGDSVIGLRVENTVTSESARVEDRVEARVTRDVRVDGKVAIPAGSHMVGAITAVERGGKVKERARLGVRFHTLVLADGSRVPVQTETIYREGDSPSGESATKIGGAAVGGAILGAILGGGRGAAIGGSIGAAGGTAAVMAGDRKPATLTAGSNVTVRLEAPVTVTVEQ
jgi:hypothetical protein